MNSKRSTGFIDSFPQRGLPLPTGIFMIVKRKINEVLNNE
jgi:hypothetical protein